jgi:acyl-coenzyme A synthetase/AMP-(fatty) acid ligase
VIINTLKLIENGCVIYNFQKKEIVLFYEAKTEKNVADLRRAVSGALPKYMIPSTFIKMENLPRNVNGKIDRLLLTTQINKL